MCCWLAAWGEDEAEEDERRQAAISAHILGLLFDICLSAFHHLPVSHCGVGSASVVEIGVRGQKRRRVSNIFLTYPASTSQIQIFQL